MTAPFADLRTGGVLRRWLKRAPVEQPMPYQRATYYIGGREVAYEDWAGDPRLPKLLSQEDFEALRGPDKPLPSGWWIGPGLLLSLILWVFIGIAAWVIWPAPASGSTLEPQYDETGRPFFRAQGPQCWDTGKLGGGPMDCALIDSIAEPAPFDVVRMIHGRAETPLETYRETGSYDYLGDPSPVPLPAGVWLLLSAVGSLAVWRKL